VSALEDAKKDMALTAQEESLYSHHLKNLEGTGKVKNADGSISTVYSTTVDIDGKTYTLPTVWNGKILEPDEAIKKAESIGLDKFPSYASPEEAMTRYQQLHTYMERDTKEYLRSQGRSKSFRSITGITQ
jgi:hypothetical protein